MTRDTCDPTARTNSHRSGLSELTWEQLDRLHSDTPDHGVVGAQLKQELDFLRQRLAAVNRLESAQFFTGKLLHDFNNILTAIAGHVSFARSTDSRSEADSALEAVLEATTRGSELIQRLRGASIEHTNGDGIRWQQVTKEALSLLRGAISRQIHVETALDDNTAPVACTESEAHQLVMNLGLNAATAMAERGGTLHVSLRQVEVAPSCSNASRSTVAAGHYACLMVKDDGCGMTDETLARAFNPFFSTKPGNTGSGLGLSVVSEIVARHKGFVEVRSTLGAGSEFRVHLPIDRPRHLNTPSDRHDAVESTNATPEGSIPH